MTEKRKQKLKQLIEEAKGSLEVRQEYNAPRSLPVDEYRKYIHERWKYFGLDRFSPFWIMPALDIGSETARLRLLEFIREELAQFLGADGDSISVATYFISSDSTNGSSLHLVDSRHIGLDFILRRLLDIALVRGAERAVSAFDTCSCPEGSRGTFQRVFVVNGIKLKTDIDVCSGIRLVPLLDSGISAKVIRYYPNFPRFSFEREFPNFFGQTLLAINQPGLSMFHKPGPNQEFLQDLPVGDLPFKVEEHGVVFQNLHEVDTFRENFSQALSLTVNAPIEIPHGGLFLAEGQTSNLRDGTFSIQIVREGLFLAEDRTFSPRHESIISLVPANRLRFFTTADENHIEQAKCLYESLVNFNSNDRDKLLIAIDRWIKSIASGSEVDKIIDLGIALEALYVSRDDKIKRQLCHRASWYLGENATHREELQTELIAIYDYRCDVVHNRGFGEEVEVGERRVPVTDLVRSAQDLCLQSIRKILDEEKFPNWETLRQTAKRNE